MRDYPSNQRMLIFSGSANPGFTDKIAEHLGIKVGEITRRKFKNGEIYIRFEESVRGADVFVVQPCGEPVNDNFMELLIMVDALKRASASMINCVIPHYPYARQDKKAEGREPITAKLVADLLKVAGMDRMIAVDLHTATIQGFFDVPVDHITAIPIIANYFKGKHIKNGVVVSPDVGGVKRASIFANQLHMPLAILDKIRPGPNMAKVDHLVGDVEGKDAIIFDDMIDTGGTICEAVNTLYNFKAKKVYIGATHPIFSGNAIEKLQSSDVEEIVVADTLPLKNDLSAGKIKMVSITGLLAKTIKKIYHCKSVSELFKGENLV
ncbi:MAG: ribose-phosphate pyrophosphokinase [Actinobacteria bacterium]|nr:ribose-phosphate pyrophosphokinase [Actinomycetota bacterium]